MASNSFGTLFKVTTWGESHGPSIGCVIDGCPSEIPITSEEINQVLQKRAPGRSPFVSPRKEPDTVTILSGVFEGKTTGAPISLLIQNKDVDSSKYEPIKDLYRPGHANYTWLHKYGVYDWRGGGRASARETCARVAAGAIAQKILSLVGVQIFSYIKSIQEITASPPEGGDLKEILDKSVLFCPDPEQEAKMVALLMATKEDSLGGVVECVAHNVPIGLGEPMYDKIQARLAYAMLSIPAAKAFEIGEGFHASKMTGSEHNDQFESESSHAKLTTNHAGGSLGGITTGEPVVFRIGFKPTASIQKPQKTTAISGENREFHLPQGSRHDPCVAIRAVPVVRAMCALVLVDAYLQNLINSNKFL